MASPSPRSKPSVDESTPFLNAADVASSPTPPEDSLSTTDTLCEPIRAHYSESSQQEDEEAQLLRTGSNETYSHHTILQVMMVLLIGMFISNADSTVVVATHPIIASEFNDLEDSSWLSISFSLAGAATQTLYAKLSDIFGRRTVLVISYALFAIGCAIVGVGQTMWQVILGRIISGSGGAGLSLVAAVAIADLVPLREVGSWNSYINLASTAGRSMGGPLGGLLADTIGWRWLFLGQSPFFVIALFLCLWVMPNTKSTATTDTNETTKERLARIDFLGALLLGLAILGFMVPLEFAGQKVPWNHPLIYITFALAILFLGLFVLVEDRDVLATYIVTFGQIPAQVSMMFTVPMYFQISQKMSATMAGAHLFPAVAGNAIGSILTGIWIKRTGRYKDIIIAAAVLASVCYALLYVRWEGNTNWLESMYIIPGGFGSGMAQGATLIALQASVSPEDKAAACAGMFLIWPIGIMAGLAISAAVMLGTVKVSLERKLSDLGLDDATKTEVIKKSVASVEYVYKAKGSIGDAVVRSYIEGISNGHLVSLAFVVLAFIGGLFIRQRKL